MRKGFLITGVVLFLFLGAIYLLIPSTLRVLAIQPVKCNVDAADRVLRDTASAAKWWADAGGSPIHTRVTDVFRRAVDVAIVDRGMQAPSRLTVFPRVNIDSCILQWETHLSAGVNPIRRIARYLEARRLAAAMQTALSSLGARLEDQRQVYGMEITPGNTTDSLLVSTVRIFPRYPSDSAIYDLVDKLREFIGRHDGHVTGAPMLSVTSEINGTYKTEVGLPTDTRIKDEGDIRGRELVRVLFLEADVHGGDSTVRKAAEQMAYYISDYQRTVMAIPFQSLITDRIKEKDTTKWVTRFYVPVFPHMSPGTPSLPSFN